MTDVQQAVPVAQSDREAAAALAENDIRLFGTEGEGMWSINAPAEMRAGQGDDWENVQAFARHRLDATQTREAELVAENKRLRELLGDYGDKRAPVQGLQGGIPWDMHLRAYDAYSRQYSPQKSLIEGGCRGGFGIRELDMFIPGWRDELEGRADAARSVPRAALNARGGA